VVGKALNAAFHGRGGGKPELVQGSVQEEEEKVRAYFQALSEK
jgi:alanyl-tRNA synthetase